MKRSFNVVVERDQESNCLVAEVVELPGCYTQAPDLPALEANIFARPSRFTSRR